MTAAFVVLPARVVLDSNLSTAAKALISVVSARETNEANRWVRLKQTEMAREIGVARETINRLAKQLYEAGYLEMRNVVSRGRGRISLEYRIRHDLPDIGAEKADVISTSHRDITSGADVSAASHHNGADVISTSHPNKTPNVESYPERVEGVSSGADASFQLAPKSQSTKTRSRPRTALGENAELSLRNRQDAAKHGFVNGSCDALWERFRNHHVARGTLMADWNAAWRTWIGNELKFRGERSGPGPHHETRFDGAANRDGQRPRSASSLILQAGYPRPVGQG